MSVSTATEMTPALVRRIGADWYNVRSFGAARDGETSDTAAIQAAINAASAAGGGTVYLPRGIYLIATRLVLKDNVVLAGDGKFVSILKASTGIVASMVIGVSGDTVADVTITALGFDGNWDDLALAINAIQITNGSRIEVEQCIFGNLGRTAVLFQGSGLGGGTPNSSANDCRFAGIGLEDSSTGFGIHFKDASSDGSAQRNTMIDIKGGMGIGGSGSAGTGYPLRCLATNNNIHMIASSVSFEAIGIQAGCDWWTINSNQVYDSQDNGISISSSYCNAIGNLIDGAGNNGILSSGIGNQIYATTGHNIGRERYIEGSDGYGITTFAVVALNGASYNTVMGITAIDDQDPHSMGYALKLHDSGGHNFCIVSAAIGYTGAASYAQDVGAPTTDVIIDLNASNTGMTMRDLFVTGQITSPGNGTLTIGGDSRYTGRIFVGGQTNPPDAQAAFVTRLASRATRGVKRIAGQTGDLDFWDDENNNRLMRIDSSGQFWLGTVLVGRGTGSPEGVVTAPVGSTWHRTDGGTGTSYYVKEAGAGNTGWVAK